MLKNYNQFKIEMIKPTITFLKIDVFVYLYSIMAHNTDIEKKVYFPSGKQIAKNIIK